MRPALHLLALVGAVLFILTNPVLGRVRYSSAGTGTTGSAKAFDAHEAARQAQASAAASAGTQAIPKTSEKDVLEDMLRE